MPRSGRVGKATSDLVDELFAAQSALAAFDRALLQRAGVPPIVIDAGMIGAASISVRLDGSYDLDQDGARAFITPVRVADPFTPEATEYEAVPQYGSLIDLIAWHPCKPDRWALRRGAASWIGCIEPQLCAPAPVAIRRSPLSWLRAGATGLCPLDRDPPRIYRVLSICRAIEGEDRDHARELRRVLERPFAIPPITVAARRQKAAANA